MLRPDVVTKYLNLENVPNSPPIIPLARSQRVSEMAMDSPEDQPATRLLFLIDMVASVE